MEAYILVNYPSRDIFKESFEMITWKSPVDALRKHFWIDFKKVSSNKCDYLIRNSRGFLWYNQV